MSSKLSLPLRIPRAWLRKGNYRLFHETRIKSDKNVDEPGSNVNKLNKFIEDTYPKSNDQPSEYQQKSGFSGISDINQLNKFIQEAYSKTKRQNDYNYPIISDELDRSTLKSLDKDLKTKLNKQCSDALSPTIQYINSLFSSMEVYNYLTEGFFNHISESLTDVKNFNQIYLPELPNDKWSKAHDDLIDQISQQSISAPTQPLYNVLTIPIIFNYCLEKLAFRYFNGQLGLTLFNQLKNNIPLYFISCNQQTYNEILRIIWIYYGNVDLYQFEKKFMEMKIMGFEGDFITFNILKVVIDEYNGLRHGFSEFNKHNSIVYTPENNNRERFFRDEFYNLKHKLEKIKDNELNDNFKPYRKNKDSIDTQSILRSLNLD